MKGGHKAPAFIAISVFITCLSIVFITEKDQMNAMIIAVAGIYSLVCLSFLLFQLYAFIKAHTDYDEDIEEIKYTIFELEDEKINYD